MYQVIHFYDVDGGFGDAIGKEKVLGFVETEEEAKAYCEKYGKDEIYSNPYAYLHCHQLGYKKVELLDTTKNPFENDNFSKEVAKFKKKNKHITICNIVWNKNDEYYSDDLPTEVEMPEIYDDDDIFYELEDKYCSALEFKRKEVNA